MKQQRLITAHERQRSVFMEQYGKPELEIIEFLDIDVLTTSDPWEPRPNETPNVSLF